MRLFCGADYETLLSWTEGPPDLLPIFTQQINCTVKIETRFSSRLPTKQKRTQKDAFVLWSGLRDSNSLPSPWQGDALPDELNPHLLCKWYYTYITCICQVQIFLPFWPHHRQRWMGQCILRIFCIGRYRFP